MFNILIKFIITFTAFLLIEKFVLRFTGEDTDHVKVV